MSSIGVVSGGTDPHPIWVGQPATAGAWTVVADASLYYRDELRRRLPDTPTSDDSATLIAHALATGGPDAIHWLEGDFALIAFDATEHRLIATRDFGGKRSLFFAWHDGVLAISTEISSLIARRGLPRGLDLTNIAAVAGGLWTHGDATAYLSVREIQAGHLLDWKAGAAPRVRPFWMAPANISTRRAPLDDAAVELQFLLDAAVRERCPSDAPTAVSLSGGWDSTAVFATARAIGRDVRPVSISYPEGDPGREDDWINAAARRWDRESMFLDVNEIPLFTDWAGEAARRPGPFAHAYEHWNRALARGARRAGAAVILDGVGGDQLFQCGDIYLADLVRTGQWGELASQVRQRAAGRDALRLLYSWGVEPNLPRSLSRAIARLRGAPPPRHYLERLPPRWFRRDFLQTHGVMAREEASRPRRTAQSHVLAESQAYLTFAFYPRIFAQLFGFAREEGIELRSPLLDERVVRFAVHRPWSDRVDGPETKRLLRRAMADRLPAELLAPRTHRTGTTNAYFLREMRRAGWPAAEGVIPDMRMASLGIIEPSHYRRAWDHVMQHDDDELAARLFFTLQAELWLRTHTS